jgi:GNAT superfamily N-acetyltransferase
MSAEIVIRRAKSSENDSVHALVQAIADETFAYLFASSQVPIGEPNWLSAWLAISGEEIVGVTMTRDEWVSDLWVRHGRRRTGIGGELLAHAEREIRSRDMAHFNFDDSSYRNVWREAQSVISAGSGGCQRPDSLEIFGVFLLKLTYRVGILQVQPELLGGPKILCQAGCHLRRDTSPLPNNVIDGGWRNMQVNGQLISGNVHWLQELFPQNFSGVHRPTCLTFIFDAHDFLLPFDSFQ